MALCRSCKAPIRWVLMDRSERAMPIDVQPSKAGTIALEGTTDDGTPLARVVPESDRAKFDHLFTSHFATCRDANQWRTPKLPGVG